MSTAVFHLRFLFHQGYFLVPFAAEAPESDGGDLLLSDDFLRYCAVMFSVPSRGIDLNSRTFSLKHLNIVDPLKENNNLGRSVSKGVSKFNSLIFCFFFWLKN